MSAAAEEIAMKAFLASVFWLAPVVFALSLITHIFALSPFDTQEVSGDKFAIHFLNTGVGAGEGIMLGCGGSLLLQHQLCQADGEDPAVPEPRLRQQQPAASL